MLGSTEILVICGVVVLLFGASALPKFARSIGKAKSEFQRGIREETEMLVSAEEKTPNTDSKSFQSS